MSDIPKYAKDPAFKDLKPLIDRTTIQQDGIWSERLKRILGELIEREEAGKQPWTPELRSLSNELIRRWNEMDITIVNRGTK